MKEVFLNVFTSVMMVIVVSALCSGITYFRKYVDGTLEKLKNDEKYKDNAFAQSSFYFIENFIAGLTNTAGADKGEGFKRKGCTGIGIKGRSEGTCD